MVGPKEFEVATEIGLGVKFDVEPGEGLAVGCANTVDVGLVDGIGLLNRFMGFGDSLGFDPPKLNNPQRNPGFLTFCCIDSELRSRLLQNKYLPEGAVSECYSTRTKVLESSPGLVVNQER